MSTYPTSTRRSDAPRKWAHRFSCRRRTSSGVIGSRGFSIPRDTSGRLQLASKRPTKPNDASDGRRRGPANDTPGALSPLDFLWDNGNTSHRVPRGREAMGQPDVEVLRGTLDM